MHAARGVRALRPQPAPLPRRAPRPRSLAQPRAAADEAPPRVSEPARQRVQALMLELGGTPPSDGAGAVRALQSQLKSAQDALAQLQEESSSTIQALRAVAERLSEERLTADAALTANERELAAARAALSQQQELLPRIRTLEMQLAELPPLEVVQALEAESAARLADAQARAAELEVRLAAAQDAVVSERVEQLVARLRAVEIELAEQPSAEDVAAAAARAAEVEAAAAAAVAERVREVQRLADRNKELEQAMQAKRSVAPPPAQLAVAAAPTPPAPAPVPLPAPRPVVYPDGIQQQLRRIEALLESLPVPDGVAIAPAAPSLSPPPAAPRAEMRGPGAVPRPPRADASAFSLSRSRRKFPPSARPLGTPVAPQPTAAPSTSPTPGFVRAPPGQFALRRHIFVVRAA